MVNVPAEIQALRSSQDVVVVRQLVRQKTTEIGFSLIGQTKLITAASELARNTVEHGHGGRVLIEPLQNGHRAGLRLVFEDSGPGIVDIRQALTDGYTSGNGLGLIRRCRKSQVEPRKRSAFRNRPAPESCRSPLSLAILN